MAATSFAEMLMILLGLGAPFNQMMGMPPGERDAKLVHAASSDSLFFAEWASRGEGKVGAEGVDGLVADPEVVHFVQRVITSLGAALQRESRIDELGDLPQFVVDLTGHPGCLFASLDDGPQAVDNAQPAVKLLTAVRAGLVVNLQDDADALSAKAMQLMSMALRREIETLDHVALPAPIPVEFHKHESYLILGVGPDAVNQIVQRIESGDGGLADNERFQSSWQKLQLERTGFVSFLDVENAATAVGGLMQMAEMIQQYMKIAGVDGAKSLMSVSGVKDGQLVTRGGFDGVAGTEGIMALFSGRGITKPDFGLTPADSDLMLALSVDLAEIKNEALATIRNIDPRGADEVAGNLDQIAGMLGIQWQTDVFDVLDDVFVVSDSPSDGGWMITNPVLTVGIKDRAAAAATLEKLTNTMKQNLPTARLEREYNKRGVTLVTSAVVGSEVTTFNIIGDDVPFAPSWCLTDTHLMLALNPQALKSRLRRKAGQDWKSFGDQYVGAAKGETIACSHIQTKALLTKLYGFLPMLSQTMLSEAQSDGLDVNITDVPSAAAILPYMSNSAYHVARVDGGLRSESQGPPFVGAITSTVPAMAPFLFFMARPMRVEMAAEAADVEVIEVLEQ